MSLVKKSFALLTLLALSVTSVGAVESRGTSKKTLSAAEAQVESDILMVQKDIIRTVR